MSKLDSAIAFAVEAHGGMKRKGKERPYILHPLEAMLIVSELCEEGRTNHYRHSIQL